MIRVQYKIEGMTYEEIVSPILTPLPAELIAHIEDIYVFDRQRTLTNLTAQRYARLFCTTES